MFGKKLYLIEILHQTTTVDEEDAFLQRCILLKFYIKPQQGLWHTCVLPRCILLKFYIKPQPNEDGRCQEVVVSY